MRVCALSAQPQAPIRCEKEAGRARCAPSARESRSRASEQVRGEADVAQLFAGRLPSCSRSPLQAELATLIARARLAVPRGGSGAGGLVGEAPGWRRLATRSRPGQVTCQSVSVTSSDLSVDPAPVLTFSRRETCRWADGRARADQGGRSCARDCSLPPHAGHCLGLPGERHNPHLEHTHSPNAGSTSKPGHTSEISGQVPPTLSVN